MIDSMINPLMILLILSMITEKFSELLKQHFFELAIEKPKGPEEDKRQTTIQTITILTGIGVALVARANLFEIFNKDFTLFWDQIVMGDMKLYYISSILGSMFTGLFLSLGSKFFHDLLSLLFEVKNFKKKLNDKSDWEFQSMKAVDEYTERDELEFLQKETEKFQDKLMKIANIMSVSLLYDEKKPVMNVYVNEQFNTNNLVPSKFRYTDINSKVKEIDTVIISNFEPRVQGSLFPGANITNKNPYTVNSYGKLGGWVFDNSNNQAILLTCYHVVKSINHKWELFCENTDEVVVDCMTNTDCGKILNAFRDDKFDVAMILPFDDSDLNDDMSNCEIPHFTRTPDITDKMNRTKVRMLGKESSDLTGYIIDFNRKVRLQYFKDFTTYMEYHLLTNIIVIHSLNNIPFSIPGDSGSFILDDSNYLIGMLVGGHNKISYVIPIESILENTNTRIKEV